MGSRAEDLTGQKFGHLTVLYRTDNHYGRTCWQCRCDCGKEKAVIARDLKAGKVKSCGCLSFQNRRIRIDLTGQKFGRLTAIEPLEKRDRKGSVYWRCRCECGNEVAATEDALVQGTTLSCGCLKRENQKEIAGRLHRIDGTCIEILEKRKYRRDNTSGFRGVFKMKNGKYRVSIGFKGKRFYLGTYDDFEDAVEARQLAEDKIHNGFLSAYYEWMQRADQEPEWGPKHPLVFEVEKSGRDIEVKSGL